MAGSNVRWEEMTVVRSAVAAALEDVIDPEVGLNLVELGLIYGIGIVEGCVVVDLGVTTPSCPYSHRLADDAAAAVRGVPGVACVDVSLRLDPAWVPAMLSDRARLLMGWR